MTDARRDEPQQWVRVPVAWVTGSGVVVSADDYAGQDVLSYGWKPLYLAAPKDSKHIERAMELARECETWWHEYCRLPIGTEAESRAAETHTEARAALRRHLVGGGSE